MKAGALAVASFTLPWLFAALLFWRNYPLPFPWPTWIWAIGAAVIALILYSDREPCLKRFFRKKEPEKTPIDFAMHPQLRLQGLLRLLALYAIMAVTAKVGYALAFAYFRTHERLGPLDLLPLCWYLAGLFSDSRASVPHAVAFASSVIGLLTGGLGYAAGRALLFPDPGPIHRGRRVASVKLACQELARHRKAGEPEIAWGGLRLPWSAGPRHFLTAGMTGSGKTNLLLQFMASVLVRIGRAKDERALVYDPKTELLSFLYGLGIGQRVRILHPLDVRGSAWDLAADVTTPSAAQQMAAVLIPEEKESKHPFFSIASQQLLAGAFIFLMKAAPGNWNLRDAILLMERSEILRQALERNPETAALVEEYFQHHDAFADVRATMANWLRRYRPIAACWHHAKDKVSLEDWVAGEYVLLLGQDDSIRVQMDAINRALVLRASQLILRGSDSSTRRSWLIIDEVRELGNLDGLSRFLTTARSKGGASAAATRPRPA